MTVSRSALEEAMSLYLQTPGHPLVEFFVMQAFTAILDGEPLEWCEEHGGPPRGVVSPDGDVCLRWEEGLGLCDFEFQVRIRVVP